MRKLTILILMLLLVKLTGFGQTVIWDEEFLELPPGWEIQDNWGTVDESLLLYYYPIIENYDLSAVSPEIDIPVNAGEMTINHFVDVYMLYATDEKCEIYVMYDNQEDLLWSHNLSEGAWGTYGGEPILFPMDDYAGKTVRVKFRSWGATTGALWGWFVYSINLTTYFDYDLTAVDLDGSNNLDPYQTGTWQVEVKNLGSQPVSNFSASLFSLKEEGEIATASYDEILNPGEVGTMEFEWSSSDVMNTCLYAEVISVEDEYDRNDASKPCFLRIEPEMDYNVLVWDNDNGIETINNPETWQLEQSSEGITKALDNAGIDYEYSNALPFNLSGYDLVITTMGSYCLS